MNRVLQSIAVPLLKEIVGFSGLDTEKIVQTVRNYASSLAVDTQTNPADLEDSD